MTPVFNNNKSYKTGLELQNNKWGHPTYPWLSAPSLSFLITVPSVIKLLLMWEPSFNRTPSAPVFAARSEPARSTKFLDCTNKKNKYQKKNTTSHVN